MSDKKTDHDGEVITRTRSRTKRPPMYNVWLLNDDYTPMDFVVFVLEAIFHRSRVDSVQVMLTVHNQGKAVAGTYTREVAETKIHQVETLAQKDGFPLKCMIDSQ